MRHARNDRGTEHRPSSSPPARAAAPRARRAPQAPAGALVPAADGHAAARRARRVAAGARLRRRSSWRSSPRWGSRRPSRDGLDPSVAFHQAKDYVSFAFLVTALLFARSGLYGDRAVRPGLSRIVASLFQVTVVVALYAIVSGEHFSSYYIFYGSLFFAVAYVVALRCAYERTTGLLLRARGLPAPRGARRHRRAHRRRGARAADSAAATASTSSASSR